MYDKDGTAVYVFNIAAPAGFPNSIISFHPADSAAPVSQMLKRVRFFEVTSSKPFGVTAIRYCINTCVDPDQCGNCKGDPKYPEVKDSCGICGGPGKDMCGICSNHPDYNTPKDMCGFCVNHPNYKTPKDKCGICIGKPNYGKEHDQCGFCPNDTFPYGYKNWGQGPTCGKCPGDYGWDPHKKCVRRQRRRLL
ncbi:MAG: hypothetical protein R3A13_07425 [Bdellovibrionota bacterium]